MILLRKKWIILGVLYICLLAHAAALQAIPPVLSQIMADLHLTYAQAGLLMSFFALPGIIISIPAGLLADRYGQKTIGLISLALLIAGCIIVAISNSFTTMAAGRIISGIGGITLTVIAPQLIVQWFAGRQMGLALGIYNTVFPLGTIVFLSFLSGFGDSMGWRACIWLSAGVGGLALLVFLGLFAPAPQRGEPVSRTPRSFRQDLKNAGTPIWLVSAGWMLFNAGLLSVLTFTPDLLRKEGFDASYAGFLTSLVLCPALILNPLIGYAAGRMRYKPLLIGCGGIVWAFLVIWIPQTQIWILPLLVTLGIIQTMMPAPLTALAAEAVEAKKLGLGYGIMATTNNIGILIGPAITGTIRDASGSYRTSYLVMALFSILITFTMIALWVYLRGKRNRSAALNTGLH